MDNPGTVNSWIFIGYYFCDLFFMGIYTMNSVYHRDRMVVGFRTTCAISAYQHWSCVFESPSWQGVLDTTLYDQVCQWLATDQRFSQSTSVSSANLTDRLDIAEIWLKVELNTITPCTCSIRYCWFEGFHTYLFP